MRQPHLGLLRGRAGQGRALVSGVANQTDWYTKPGTFVTPTTVASGLVDQMMVAKQYAKAKKFANLYCQEVAACGQAVALQKPSAAKIGIGYTSLAVSSTATSYTAQCLQLQQQGVDYAQLNFTTSAAAKFVQDCQAQNYNPIWGTSEQAAGKDLLRLHGLPRLRSGIRVPVHQGRRCLPDVPRRHGQVRQGQRLEGRQRQLRLGRIRDTAQGPRKCRARARPGRTCMTALGTIQSDDLGGLLPNKVSLDPKKPAGYFSSPCSFVLEIKDGKLTSPSGTVCGGLS